MTEMVERVARAICASRGLEPDQLIYIGVPAVFNAGLGLFGGVLIPAPENQRKAWEAFTVDASCAIGAMRKPTDEMMRAFYGDMPVESWLGDDWRAMIDAALKPASNHE